MSTRLESTRLYSTRLNRVTTMLAIHGNFVDKHQSPWLRRPLAIQLTIRPSVSQSVRQSVSQAARERREISRVIETVFSRANGTRLKSMCEDRTSSDDSRRKNIPKHDADVEVRNRSDSKKERPDTTTRRRSCTSTKLNLTRG